MCGGGGAAGAGDGRGGGGVAEELNIMINSVMRSQKPQINADERRLVVPALSTVLVLIDTIQKNEIILTTNSYELNTNCWSSFQFVLVRCFFSGSFMSQGFKADFTVNNSANRSKPPLELKIFNHNLKRGGIKS
jgi:hypothetical protein